MRWRIASGSAVTPSLISQFATEFFEIFCIVQVSAVLLLTPALVAGSIAEEKERRTLDYLLASDLRNWEIVIGKLAARMLHLMVLIAVGWPILALLRLLGGVAMENVLAAFAITASTALATGALSIWCSVQARRARDAVMRVFVIGLALLLLPPLVTIFSRFGSSSWVALESVTDEFLAANPYACLNGAITQSGTHWAPVIQLVRNQALLTVPCVLLALWRVRRVYLKDSTSAIAHRARRAIRLLRLPMGDMPVLWKELFAERPALSLGIIGLIAQTLLFLAAIGPGVWIFVLAVTGHRAGYFDELHWYVTVVGTAVSCVGLLMVAVHAAGSISVERERQTWDGLLSTPIEPSQIIHGKLAGSLYAMRGLLCVQIILWVLGVLGRSIWLVALPILLFELAVFGLFAALVGILFSMRLRTSLRAMAATVVTTIFVGGAYLLCCFPALWNGPNDSAILLAGCAPFLLALPLAVEPKELASLGRMDGKLLATYVMGLGFYIAATVCLYGVVRANFDELTGRVCRSVGRIGLSARSGPPGRNPEDRRTAAGREPDA
jgi:ABC-type transport system involved in multi-copper enzyme maturation permease subunit